MIASLLLTVAVSASPYSDELLPNRGNVGVTVATGVPYLAIAEVAYGVSDRFAIGALAGFTPITYGVGLRTRGVIVDGESARLVGNMPLLYYPATRTLGHEPWVLAMPQLLVEHPLDNGGKLHAGLGLALATCTGAIEGLFTGHHDHEDGDGFMGGVWNTATIGGTLPMGTFRLFFDATLILHGVRLSGSDWIGGPPVVITLGLQRQL